MLIKVGADSALLLLFAPPIFQTSAGNDISFFLGNDEIDIVVWILVTFIQLSSHFCA